MKAFKFKNKWHYTIKPCEYGFELIIYKNREVYFKNGGYSQENFCKDRLLKYVLENEFNLDLWND